MSPRDLRGMVPPEPLEIILDQAEILKPGEQAGFILPHYPAPLIPHLQAMGLQFHSSLTDDGGVLLTLVRP
jgi:uncharacterized protein (DUF2249 family)